MAEEFERIVREYQPRRVILFGSYARGTANADSDVDLLVVMPYKGEPWDLPVKIRLAIDIHFPVDILVRDPEVIRQRIGWNDFFLKEIMEQGKVLYESRHRRVGGQGGGRLPLCAARASRT